MENIIKFLFTANDKEGLSQKYIDIIIEEINKLMTLYPKVTVEIVGDCYTYELDVYELLKGKLIESKKLEENKVKEYMRNIKYYKPNFKIDINGNKYDTRNYLAEYNSKERRILFNHTNIKKRLDEITFNFRKEGYIKDIVWHEWGHVLGYQYSLNKNEEILKIHKTIDTQIAKFDIRDERSINNIHEMIASGFMESEFGYESMNLISRKIRGVIDNVVKESKPMSESEKNRIELNQYINEQLGFDLLKDD
ncbi:hypothetical protein [Brassicibacter mesophilus]|uniref:hypothetical protein n=1 Tax=Brassicibacter mesophilus TaxID=745119 RepID=UPI003D1A9309